MATITTVQAKHVASQSKTTGKALLQEYLGWPTFDEDRQLQTSIHLDYLYDHLIFSVEKGFTWTQVCTVMKFADNFLQYCIGKPLTDAIRMYTIKSEYIGTHLGERNYKVYTDFIFSTFMCHYKLFQYVFMNEREQQIPNIQKIVELPVPSEGLRDAKEIDIWNYNKQLKEIEISEEKATNERMMLKEHNRQKTADDLNASMDKMQTPFTKESLSEILQTIIRSHTEATVDNIRDSIDEVQDDLEFKLQKTSLPRPQVLGPPPRFKTKTPITVPKIKKPPTPISRERTLKSRESSRSGGKNRTAKP